MHCHHRHRQSCIRRPRHRRQPVGGSNSRGNRKEAGAEERAEAAAAAAVEAAPTEGEEEADGPRSPRKVSPTKR